MLIIQKESPNYSSRLGTKVDTVILHATVGNCLSSLNWLTNKESKVSAHYLVCKTGVIYKLVPVKYAAWHCGKSNLEKANLRSIGIEIENKNDGIDPYTKEQLESLEKLIKLLVRYYPIKYIYGHYEIAPKRKTDPKGLDISVYRRLLKNEQK